MRSSSGSVRRRFLTTAVAVLGATSTSAAWSASGTVKTTTGSAIAGVAVTIKDSSSSLNTTTDANGNFTIGSTTALLEPTPRAFAAQVVGNELSVSSPQDGPLDLDLVDASGRSLWSVTAQASHGMAHAVLPAGLGHGAVFLRLRSADAVRYQAVITGSAGMKLAPPAARSMAVLPCLSFSKSGFDDTTYAMTSASQNGIAVVMSSTNTTCPLPTTFKWTSTAALAQPKSGWKALKDFSSVVYNNQHVVYLSTVDNSGSYAGAMMTFADWPQMATATQRPLSSGGIVEELSLGEGFIGGFEEVVEAGTE